MRSPIHPSALLTALLLGLGSGACTSPNVRVPARAPDTTTSLDSTPLLVELPEDDAIDELHVPHGRPTIGTDERYSLQFRGTPLVDAFATIAAEASVTLIPGDTIDGVLDLDFEDATLDQVLGTLLELEDLSLVEGPGDVLFVERNDDPRTVTEFFQLANLRAADVVTNLELLVPGSLVIADADRNVVCVVGPRSDAFAVRRYLHELDRRKEQVLVEVHIFEVSYEDGFQMGALHDVAGTINGNAFDVLSSFGSGGDFSLTLSDDKGNLDSTVDAVRSFVGLELISSPRILAVTNTKALVDVVQEIPFVQVTATTTGTTAGVGSTVQEEVLFKEAGIKLEITPSIQEAGFLQMDISQSILEEVGRFNDIPIIDRRTLATQFLVEDRETIVLGGLIQERHSESRRGVPILMHIPILGQLFRADDDAKRKSELVLFVTPRVVSPSQAAQLAPLYRSQYRESRKDLSFPEIAPGD